LEDDALLRDLVSKWGLAFKRIALCFPKRNQYDVQERWNWLSCSHIPCTEGNIPIAESSPIETVPQIGKSKMAERNPSIPQNGGVRTHLDFGDAFWLSIAENDFSDLVF
jgi:hypothetical protein